MQTLGDYLKKNREAQNFSLSDVADYTKISKIYLDCLENNEFKKIPAKAYVKGYISSYAACLGIDQHEALKRYDSFQNETADAEEFASEILQDKKSATPYFPRPNKKTGIALAVVLLITLSFGLYYSFFQDQKKAVVGDNLEEQLKTTNPTPIATVAYDLPPKNQDKTSFQSGKQGGFEKTIEAGTVRTKPNDGMSQKSDPPKIQQLQPKSKDAASDQPIAEFSRVKELSGSGTAPIHDENNLKIIEAAACSSVKDRTPQGPGDCFEWSMDRIFIWTRIQSETLPASIRHIYYFKGEKVSDILLNIRSSPWRTWSYKTLSNKRYIGPWRVDIASIDGKLLQSINFEII
jgi:cytoskeletal protein RodZ